MATFPINLKVNGAAVSRSVEPRMLLSDFLRDELDLKGTHVGCEHGVCGTCTVLIDGQSARSCLTFAVQADKGEKVTCGVTTPLANDCHLNKPWQDYITDYKGGNLKGDAAREFHKALLHYVRALRLKAKPYEVTFRLADLHHHEALLAKKAALQAWDNLIAVPLDQIDAFYQAGLKPAEIADLIVKALGFTAIAIGVSK